MFLHSLRYLNIWFPAGGTVLEGLGSRAFLEEVNHRDQDLRLKTSYHVQFALFSSCLPWKVWAPSFLLPWLPCTVICPHYDGLLSLWKVKISFFLLQGVLVMMFLSQQQKSNWRKPQLPSPPSAQLILLDSTMCFVSPERSITCPKFPCTSPVSLCYSFDIMPGRLSIFDSTHTGSWTSS